MNRYFFVNLIILIIGCRSIVEYDPLVIKQVAKPLKIAIKTKPMLFHDFEKEPVATEFFIIKSQMNGLMTDLKLVAFIEKLEYFIAAYPEYSSTYSSTTNEGTYRRTTTVYGQSFVYPKNQEHLATNDTDRIFVISKIPPSLQETLLKIGSEQIDRKDANTWYSVSGKEEANAFLEITPNYSHYGKSSSTNVLEYTPIWIEASLKNRDGKEIMHCKSAHYLFMASFIIKDMKQPEDKFIYEYLLDGYRRDPNDSKGMRKMLNKCMSEITKALKEP